MPSEANAVIYLRRKTAELYPPRGSAPIMLEFPESAYNKLTVIDKERVKEIFTEFLGSYGIKSSRFLIVLAGELLFRRTLLVRSPEEERKSANDFYGEIPFNREKMAGKEIRRGGETTFFAVNKELFMIVKNIIEKNGGKLDAVVPLPVLGFSNSNFILTEEIWKKLTADSALIKTADFLTDLTKDTPDFVSAQDKATKPVNKLRLVQTLLLGLLIVALLIITYLTFVWLMRPNSRRPEVISPGTEVPTSAVTTSQYLVPEPSSTSSPTLSPTPKKSYAASTQLTISILNGSGVSGLASRVRNLLIKDGYSNLSVGNKDNYSKEETAVTFSSRVDPVNRQQIIEELERVIKTTAVTEASEQPEVDVYIILGSPR